MTKKENVRTSFLSAEQKKEYEDELNSDQLKVFKDFEEYKHSKMKKGGETLIDSGLDVVLLMHHENKHFPLNIYSKAKEYNLLDESIFTKEQLSFIEDFKRVDLPLFNVEDGLLHSAVSKYEYHKKQLDNISKWQNKVHSSLADTTPEDSDIDDKSEDQQDAKLKQAIAESKAQDEINDVINDLKKNYLKSFRFMFTEVAENHLRYRDPLSLFAVYCIFNFGNFNRFERINTLDEAYQKGMDFLVQHKSFYRMLKQLHPFVDFDEILTKRINFYYKIMENKLILIGRDAQGNPISLNHNHVIED